MHRSAINRLPVHKRIARSCRYRPNVTRVGIIEIVVVGIQHVDVRDARVVDVHVAHVKVAGVIPRMKRFAVSEREPTDSAAEPSTKSEPTTKVSAAHKSDERRSIERTRINRARAPAPRAADKRPASIVIRRESPRRVIHPSPAPRADPVPISVAIGSPTDLDRARVPHRAVVRFFTP